MSATRIRAKTIYTKFRFVHAISDGFVSFVQCEEPGCLTDQQVRESFVSDKRNWGWHLDLDSIVFVADTSSL